MPRYVRQRLYPVHVRDVREFYRAGAAKHITQRFDLAAAVGGFQAVAVAQFLYETLDEAVCFHAEGANGADHVLAETAQVEPEFVEFLRFAQMPGGRSVRLFEFSTQPRETRLHRMRVIAFIVRLVNSPISPVDRRSCCIVCCSVALIC